MRKSNSKLLPVLRAMDAFTAPAPQPRMSATGRRWHETMRRFNDEQALQPIIERAAHVACERGGRVITRADLIEAENTIARQELTQAVLEAETHMPAPAPAEPQHAAYVSDYCEPQTARHDLCTDGGCECACHRTAPAQPEPQAQDAVTCHLCGALVEADALDVQTAADGTPRLDHFYCRKHLVAGTERLKAAIRAEKGA